MSEFKADESDETMVFSMPKRSGIETQAKVMALELVKKSGQPEVYRLTNNVYTLGRSQKADITVNSPKLSRKHVLLQRENGSFSITDLDSTNGFYLNGTKVHAAQLYHGDLIQLGDLLFRFREWGG